MPDSQLQGRLRRIENLTQQARQSPDAFRAELRRLMRLGRLYVTGVFAFIVVLLLGSVVAIPAGGGLAAVFLLWIFGGSAFFIWRSMRLWSQPPPGVAIKRSEAPRLFDLVDEVRREAGVRNIHRVHLTDDFNASVVITRSRGIFGKRRNYLCLGLPLMHALSKDELRAVIAHECAHLSDSQSTDLMHIWQLQSVWQSVAVHMLRGDAFGGFLFRPFFRWFLPRFIEHSVVFCRELELDADHHGVVQTGRATAVELELRLAVVGLKLNDRQAEEMLQMLAEESEPPPGLTALKCTLAEEPLTDKDNAYLNLALARSTGWRDSHPALKDRLISYGFDPEDARLPGNVQQRAAHVLLDEGSEAFAAAIDAEARPRATGWWLHRHSIVAKEMEALRILEHDLRFGDISDEEHRQRAMLIARYRPSDSALARRELEQRVDVDTENDPHILYALGRLRLREGDRSGIELLERAAAIRPELQAQTRLQVGTYHATEGRKEEAEAALREAAEAVDASMQDQVERFIVGDSVPIEPHQLEEHELVALRDALTREADVAEAWLVRKQLAQATSRPVYVLMVRDELEGKALFIGRARQKLFEELNRRISVGEGDVMIVPLCEPLYGLWQRMRSAEQAHVYLKRGEQPYQ